MTVVNTIDIYIFFFFVSLIIYVDLLGKFDKNSLQDEFFLSMLAINSIVLVCEALYVAFNKVPGDLFIAINAVSNIIVFCGTTIIEALWILYIDYQVYHDEIRIKKYKIPFVCVLSIYIFMAVLSPFTGWFFYVDGLNIYTRGSLYIIHVLINFGFVWYAFAFIISKRKKIKPSYFWALFLFIVPPVILAIVQVLFYGLELIWGGITLSLLIVYFNIQNHTMNVDYLTGAYNRKKMDNYIKDKIAESSESKTFSAIMIDLNDFKQINDNYGHPIGDVVLRHTVKLIEENVRHNDFIARFGGDEFIIVLNSSSKEELMKTVAHLESAVVNYNETQSKPYNLSFCMGYAVYDYQSKMNGAAFIKYVDELMYESKRIYKAKHNA